MDVLEGHVGSVPYPFLHLCLPPSYILTLPYLPVFSICPYVLPKVVCAGISDCLPFLVYTSSCTDAYSLSLSVAFL